MSSHKLIARIGLSCILAGSALHATAANLQAFYQNVSGLGNAYSGEAVSTDDASVGYFNPAGLIQIKQPEIVAGMIVTRYSVQAAGTTLNYSNGLTQTGVATSKALAPWPVFYYARPINEKLAFGLGVTSSFGTGAQLPDDSIVRYSTQRYVFYTTDFTPSFAYKINNCFSVGFGIDIASLNQTNNYEVASTTAGAPDSKNLTTVSDWGHGWHAGLLYQITPKTRVGLTYRSKITYHPHGTSELVMVPGSHVGNEVISNNFKFTTYMPPITTLSASHQINPRWTILGTIDYVQFNIQKHIYVRNVAAPGPSQFNFDIPLHHNNTWRVALGTNYILNPKWTLRVGGSLEQDPTNTSIRAFTDPNTAATSLAVGARYQVLKTLGIDMGYEHFFIHNGGAPATAAPGSTLVTRNFHEDSVGAQVVWDMA